MVLRPRAAPWPDRISGERISQRLTLACVENKGLCIDTVGVRKGITGGSTRVLSSPLQRAKPFASSGLRGRHSERPEAVSWCRSCSTSGQAAEESVFGLSPGDAFTGRGILRLRSAANRLPRAQDGALRQRMRSLHLHFADLHDRLDIGVVWDIAQNLLSMHAK